MIPQFEPKNPNKKGDDKMNKPYIFMHMMTSVDGKIMGHYMDTPESEIAGEIFYNIAFGKNPYYKHQGWLSGRVTTDDNFTNYKKPELHDDAPQVEQGDYIVPSHTTMYYVSIDPSGKLGWDENTLTYEDTTATIIEVLTNKASNSYKDFLRRKNISYIIAGDEELDCRLVVEKCKELFHIETLMLGGGGVLNWSFIQANLCDEISVVIAPCADGSSSTPTLFETGKKSQDIPVSFTLQQAQVMKDSVLWLRYLVKNNIEEI